ncbi:MAG: efflux RND transporter permease subunit [Bacteroidales bacterium]|nr:efflux RND transporter permease subunit [Bacteroidales bacterium]MBP3254775.1 efflux RND transporter permease subunit [Bacteroidales bacterium]
MKTIIKYFLQNRAVTAIVLTVIIAGGIYTAPFEWTKGSFPRNPVSVDAIPDVGDNQQIVTCEWMGRSPKDIQNQITYPLTTQLIGIPGVKTVRSSSMFGMSFIYIIFDDKTDFYFSRSRILEKLNSLPDGTLPEGVKPTLGPDATALGQIFWYTLEGRDTKTGKPSGGWTPQELRSIQDYYVKYALSSAEGVSEVASVGGYVKEYQVDLDPQKMLAYNIDIMQVMQAVSNSNIDVSAGTMEINRMEYLIRGLGYIHSIEDLENAVITSVNGVPVRIKDVCKVNVGPSEKRGGLDKEGVQATGGVVVARYGANPMEVINNVKAKIEESHAGMPQKTLKDGSVSKVTIVPFYDRTQLIKETIGTLESSLLHEILICIIVVLILVLNLRSSLVIASMLPLAVLMTFIIMKLTGLQANIVALSGIAIAIGIMVDVGVVFVENTIKRLDANKKAGSNEDLVQTILHAVNEVAPAVTTGMLTTVVSFLPVFAMQAQEGKMFRPLAFTKTFALMSAFILGITVLPTLIYWIFSIHWPEKFKTKVRKATSSIRDNKLVRFVFRNKKPITLIAVITIAVYILSFKWMPLGADKGVTLNTLFVFLIIGFILAMLWLLVVFYERILSWCLRNRVKFMLIPLFTLLLGITIWFGTEKLIGIPTKWFPGVGKEFMPSLDEGSFMLMPTSMPHSGVEQNTEYISVMDRRIKNIPEVECVVGKWGRVNSALDPAPVQMYETTINYRSEYLLDASGKRARFKTDSKGRFILKNGGKYDPEHEFRIFTADSLVRSSYGRYLRQWRKNIKSTDDIWNEISAAATIPGVTTAPKLQPIATRMVMLSTGMRAPMGIKITASSAQDIEKAGLILEKELKNVAQVNPSSVFYDRSLSSAYMEIKPDREKMARYGITIATLQDVVTAAIGNMPMTTVVDGRERYQVRVRYPRELRDNPHEIENILVPAADGIQIPLSQVADLEFTKGEQMIQSENTFLTGYVIFDKQGAVAETDVVHKAKTYIDNRIKEGKISLPNGVSYRFAGNYEQQERASKRLALVIPVSLLIILMILYFQFKSITASLIHFSGVFVAFAGGFILIWLYSQPWFLDFSVLGTNLRDMFNINGTINLSVAVWVGFIALFGIATDDGVLMGTYIHQVFLEDKPSTQKEIFLAVVKAGKKRVRPAAMTTATTLIALLPVLSSVGKGSDIMIPMSIPCFGGMLLQVMTMFVVPVLQYTWRSAALKHKINSETK